MYIWHVKLAAKVYRVTKGYRILIFGISLIFIGYKTKKDELGALGSGIIIARYGYLKEHNHDNTTKGNRTTDN